MTTSESAPRLGGAPSLARIVAALLFSAPLAFPQPTSPTPESTYITDLTTAMGDILSGSTAAPLPKVKFAAHHLLGDGAYLKVLSGTIVPLCPASLISWGSCPLKLYADGLIGMGVDRININVWIAPFADGNTTIQTLYVNLVNYIHSQTCNGHTCEVELDPADLSLTELTGCSPIPTDMSHYLTCLTTTTGAMATMATAGYTQQPEYFTIVHECSTMNGRFGWDGVSAGSASDWSTFVDGVAGALTAASYTGMVGAGGCLYWEDGNTIVGGNVVPNFCGNGMYGFNTDTNLRYITYDVYNANSTTGPATYATNVLNRMYGNYVSEIAATLAAGKTDVRIEESGRPPFVYSWGTSGPNSTLADIETNTTVDSYRGCGWADWNTYGSDRQWLDMIYKFASAQKMTSVAVFYTFPFFAYTNKPADLNVDCNPTAPYVTDFLSNFLASTSATGLYYQSLSRNWPTVIATGKVMLTGSVKLQ